MADQEAMKPKDKWDKIEIMLGPLGGLLTAITIAIISIYASGYLGKAQERDTRTRLYTELMSKREDAESSIRKDMFNSIMGNILKDSSTLDEKILQLELLAYNFHESLNLMPLFEYLDRTINYRYAAQRISYQSEQAYKLRLIKTSKDIINKQTASLASVTRPVIFTYQDSSYKSDTEPVFATTDPEDDSGQDNISYTFFDTLHADNVHTPMRQIVRLAVLSYDTVKISAKVKLTVQTSIAGRPVRVNTPEFIVNYFEFPLIDNTRLENDMRLAVVLSCFNYDCTGTTVNDENTLCLNPNIYHNLEVLYFPGSRSSMKEKPYFEDIVGKLITEK